MNWFEFFEKGIWLGFAALGFAVLFNVPQRTLLIIWILGALGGLVKILMVHSGFSVVMGSLAGATIIGISSVYAAHSKHAPPLVFAIPSVIPMVPGVFAYKMMLGLIHLAGNKVTDGYDQILNETVNNGLKVFLILMCLSVGVAFPTLVTGKSSIKDIKIFKGKVKAD